jgi:hypothetical protein
MNLILTGECKVEQRQRLHRDRPGGGTSNRNDRPPAAGSGIAGPPRSCREFRFFGEFIDASCAGASRRVPQDLAGAPHRQLPTCLGVSVARL